MNGLFLLFALLLCVLALTFVLYPLLREPRRETLPSRRAVNASVHRDRVHELEQDLAAGTLTQAQYATAVADLERELLDSGAIEPDETPSDAGQGGARAVGAAAIVSIAVLPFMAIGIYLAVGHAEEVFATQRPAGEMAVAEPTAATEAELRRQFQLMAQQLQGRLAQQPDDVESWVLLGRTLVFLEDLDAAERAFREAMAHGGDGDPDLLTRYADVMAERQGGLSGEPLRLIEQALEIDPYHAQGLWLAGSRAYLEGEMTSARDYWERLLDVLPPDSPEAEIIRGNLAQVTQTTTEG
ncbi:MULTISPECIES: c-type cytochrome biogenesis protein CcmI [Halomonadaceae]|jgi:cytochrome c-type biogenesis protein CcmH|uniref:C-type cytochrome biogenesis protein CcmI n=1 Tax=Billgrantia aerodenitrificans TaxID=2733483 RepID=A0ABS9APS5_9GAMM|nr:MULTISPECIES: c-type cytochrome biogenesis protein CcmI [Halomonas]MCE8023840.1 c-type cytochrome biogenesis protein CcmI [Halomonas aerodenitrificans]MCE8036088.1 c-type cytochrome biogenesis protein CcmI [Halomonas sp. MCCC 1A11062]